MEENLFSWGMEDGDAFLYCCPCRQLLPPKAALVVKPNQAAYLNIGGRTVRWVYKSGTYPIGLEDTRTINEIVSAWQAGEMGVIGLLPEVCFFDLRPHRIEVARLQFPTREGVLHADFSCQLRICDPEIIMGTAFPHDEFIGLDSPLLSGILKDMNSRIESDAKEMVNAIPPGDLQNAAQKAFTDALPALERETAKKLDGTGFLADRLSFTLRWIPSLRCAQCGEPIERGARFCEKGHRQYWCPTCREPVQPDWFTCRAGHPLLWCSACDRFVAVQGGRFCPEGHGACYPR